MYGASFTPAFAYTGDGTETMISSTLSTYTVVGGVVTRVGVGSCTLTANATAGATSGAVSGPTQFTIGQVAASVHGHRL